MKKTITRITFSLLLAIAPAPCVNAQYQIGVDVSHYQGVIDWTTAHNEGVSFAFTKATEGVDFVDSNFTQNMTGAKAAGVVIGNDLALTAYSERCYARTESFGIGQRMSTARRGLVA